MYGMHGIYVNMYVCMYVCMHVGPIRESKGMHVIFQKKGKTMLKKG